MTSFKREHRYYVAKKADVDKHLSKGDRDLLERILARLAQKRHMAGKPPLECVVVESDWPEYEPTWEALEQRVRLEGMSKLLENLGACPDCLTVPEMDTDGPFSSCQCNTGEDYGRRPLQELQILKRNGGI